MTSRAAAAEVIAQVLRGQSLSVALPNYLDKVDDKDRAFLQELCFGTLRWYPAIELEIAQLLKKPLREKDFEIQALLACGIYQLSRMRTADHAAINETVKATGKLGRQWAKGLTNAVLRNYQRQQAQLRQKLIGNPVYSSAFPLWLLDKIKHAWPEQAAQIVDSSNQKPPMVLRVNAQRHSQETYLQQLQNMGIEASVTLFSPWGITLQTPVDVDALPGFDQGSVSVQDEAAQLAAELLDLQPGQRVLDACCAPGGKTCHILERQPDLLELTAVDLEQRRMVRVEENLQRLGLQANLKVSDVSDLKSWWDNQSFDRILLDAPCSATGVIRRHPDIKVLRKPEDVAKLRAIQLELLQNVWQTLKEGGILLYATCSILPEENEQVVSDFLALEQSASALTIETNWGVETAHGRQLFPTTQGNDGFFYARLQKQQHS